MPSPTLEPQTGPEADRGPARVRLDARPYYPVVFVGFGGVFGAGELRTAAVGVTGLVSFPVLPMRAPRRIRRQRLRCTEYGFGRLVGGRVESDCVETEVGRWYIEREIQVAPSVGVPFLVARRDSTDGTDSFDAEERRYRRQSFVGGFLGASLRRSRTASVAGLGFSLDVGWQFGRFARGLCVDEEPCTRSSEVTAATARVAAGMTAGRFAFGLDYQYIALAGEDRLNVFALYAGVHY